MVPSNHQPVATVFWPSLASTAQLTLHRISGPEQLIATMPDYTPTWTEPLPGQPPTLSPAEAQLAQAQQLAKARLTEAQKKQNHIVSEQKRREAIRAGFDQLASIVPGMAGQGRSEAVVLQATVEYMRQVVGKKQELVARAKAKGWSDRQIEEVYETALILKKNADAEERKTKGANKGNIVLPKAAQPEEDDDDGEEDGDNDDDEDEDEEDGGQHGDNDDARIAAPARYGRR